MEVNEINKELYEAAFIQNGEYGYSQNTWKPSIDERQIHECCEDENGNYVPATPLGYRDYKISRMQGIQNIMSQVPCVDLTNDRFHHIKKSDNVIKLYDKIKINDDEFFIVVGDYDNEYFVVSETNHRYRVAYEKE